MKENLTAEVIGRMYLVGISRKELAKETGITTAYLTAILNGRKPGSEKLQQKIFDTLERLEDERNRKIDIL